MNSRFKISKADNSLITTSVRRPVHFVEGERVFVKNHRPTGEKWLSGEIVKSTGPVSFTVRMSDGTTIRSHQDHLRKRATVTEEQTDPPAGEEVETGT